MQLPETGYTMQYFNVDKENNRLMIKIEGSVTVSEAKAISVMIRRKVNELSPGFIVIDDLMDFKMSDPRAGISLQEVLKCFIDHKARGVVRIVGKSKMAIILFNQFSRIFQPQLPIIYIPSHAELSEAIEKIRAKHTTHSK